MDYLYLWRNKTSISLFYGNQGLKAGQVEQFVVAQGRDRSVFRRDEPGCVGQHQPDVDPAFPPEYVVRRHTEFFAYLSDHPPRAMQAFYRTC